MPYNKIGDNMSEDVKYSSNIVLEGKNEKQLINEKDAKEHDKQLCKTMQECLKVPARLKYNKSDNREIAYVEIHGRLTVISIYSQEEYGGIKNYSYFSIDVDGLKQLLKCDKSN